MSVERAVMNRNRTLVRPAFSLLELTLVVLLIGILMAVVAINVPGYLERARTTATWASMRQIKTALSTYSGYSGGAYPGTLGALQQGSSAPLDPTMTLQDGWKHPFVYATPGTNGRAYDLYSKGPNGTFEAGAGDDLDIWKEPKE
jgi:general secretion pathway protein G